MTMEMRTKRADWLCQKCKWTMGVAKEMEDLLWKSERHVFRNTLRPIPTLTTCPSSPAAREPISVAISFDLLRKGKVMVQKANVSHGKTKMGQDCEKERGTLRSSFKVVV
ncbi:hypothetical protein [Absidia glauca]|uniref:Uncharacterized protein n=1 Tax=Absidia glauca TaxID=4829 RepID=A0A168RFB0_ABSGL|nr:hypothetical protein [Absidia glauca]